MVRIIVCILSLIFMGCGKGSDDIAANKAKNTLSEHEFAADNALRMKPGQTVAMFMEPRDAKTVNHADTETIGTDIIPIKIEHEGAYTFSLDDSGVHRIIANAEMMRLPGREKIFEIHDGNRVVTITLTPGNYEMILRSGYTVKNSGGADHRVVFLRHEAQKGNENSDRNDKNIHTKVVLSQSCPGCDLVKVNLTGANLTETNLSKADLTMANLTGANLTGTNLIDADTTGTIWTTGTTGRNITVINNCPIDIWAGVSGNNVPKNCSSSDDCNGGACVEKICKDIYCSLHSDCPGTNSYCGGLASYKGSCRGNVDSECGKNRFCDKDNKNYYPPPNTCNTDDDCAKRTSNAMCDINEKRCYFYQCGWKTCYFVPVPVKETVSPQKECTSNADCCTRDSANNIASCDSFCYTTSSEKGQCAMINLEGNGWKMNPSGSTQTLPMPTPWGGRFWPRTGCSGSNNLQCDTGQCLGSDGKTFSLNCVAPGTNSPTLAEVFMPAYDGSNNDFYDISMVDGANVPLQIAPDPNSYNLATANAIDRNASCKTNTDCWANKKSPSWACDISQGYCINKFQCGSPGCVSDCTTYGFGSYLKKSLWDKSAPYAVAEKDCPEELRLKNKAGRYVSCMSPKDACGQPSPHQNLKCNQAVSGQGTYMNLYMCDGANSTSCYNDLIKDSKCCGCPEWTPEQFCHAGTNLPWITYAQPYYKIFNTASPTSYSFPYDDFNSTFTCIGKSREVNVNYKITFCPK